MKYYQDNLVLCPYYKMERKQVIMCEGPDTDTGIHVTFCGSKKTCYKNTFCKGDWKSCRIAKMLNDKWGI